MRRYLQLPMALVLLAAAACESALPTASPLAADSARYAKGSTSLPFRLRLIGNANPDFSDGPCHVVNVESGTGTAEHLGLVTWTSTEVANFCVDPNDPNTAAVSGTMVITAANGDQLTQTYTATVYVDATSPTLNASGEYVVTGGTGRFSDASGSGTLSVNGSLVPPFGVTGTYSGEISY